MTQYLCSESLSSDLWILDLFLLPWLVRWWLTLLRTGIRLGWASSRDLARLGLGIWPLPPNGLFGVLDRAWLGPSHGFWGPEVKLPHGAPGFNRKVLRVNFAPRENGALNLYLKPAKGVPQCLWGPVCATNRVFWGENISGLWRAPASCVGHISQGAGWQHIVVCTGGFFNQRICV